VTDSSPVTTAAALHDGFSAKGVQNVVQTAIPFRHALFHKPCYPLALRHLLPSQSSGLQIRCRRPVADYVDHVDALKAAGHAFGPL
jgi:hypothetical protein